MGSQTSATGNRRQGRILVVADVAAERKSISTSLAHTGYEVEEAESGEQAIKLAQDGHHPLAIDVVLCDMRMTPGDGVDTIAFFRRTYPATPVMALTGQPDFELAVSLSRRWCGD